MLNKLNNYFEPAGFPNRFLPYFLAAIIGLLLVIMVFPDVIFSNTTISMGSLFAAHQKNLTPLRFFLEPEHRSWHHGLSDAGGAVFQSEPMIQFIKNALYQFESIYWNPYSAAGSLGPESLVDMKASFFTFLVALLGGSTVAFDTVMLSLFFLGLFFLYLVLNQYFKLSQIGSVASCILYILNGYIVANLSSNVSQSFLYFPILLFTLCAFIHTPTAVRLAFVILANVIMLSNTFLPTTFLVLMATYAVAFGYMLSLHKSSLKHMFKLMAVLGGSLLIAFLSLSLIYFPVIESFSFLNVVDMYNERTFFFAKWPSLLSFFSPKHFFDSYNAIDAHLHGWCSNHRDSPLCSLAAHSTINSSLIGNSVFHFGVIPVLVAFAALTRWRSAHSFIVTTLFILLTICMGRIYRLPGVSDLVGVIYGFRSLGEQYWWIATAIILTLLVGYGLEALKEKRAKWWPIAMVYAVILICFFSFYRWFGFIEPYQEYRSVATLILAAIVLISFALMWCIKKSASENTIKFLSVLFLLAMFAELSYYSHHVRFKRIDIFKNPSQEVAFLKEHAKHHRVSTIGWHGLPAEYGAAYQIQQIESMNMNIVPSYLKYFQKNFLPDKSQRWGDFPTFHNIKDIPMFNLAALDFLGVKYVAVPVTFENYKTLFSGHGYRIALETPTAIIYENPHVFPRIFAVSVLLNKEGTPDLEGMSLRDTAFTEDKKLIELSKKEGISSEMPGMPPLHFKDNEVQLLEYHHAKIKASTHLAAPAVVLLTDNWHPNWEASLDGKPCYVGLVNESFRGVVVPKGDHVLEMVYKPKSFNIGKYMTLGSVFGVLCLILFRRKIDKFLKKA